MLKLKSLLISLALVLPMMFSLVSCDDDTVWDIVPLTITVDFQDAEGRSLLQPDVEGSIVGEPMEIVYKDKTYPAVWNDEVAGRNTRAILAVFEGMKYVESGNWIDGEWKPDGKYLMSIRELPRDETYDETLVIKFSGKEYPIRVKNSFGWDDDEPDVATDVYFDGSLVKTFPVIIRLD